MPTAALLVALYVDLDASASMATPEGDRVVDVLNRAVRVAATVVGEQVLAAPMAPSVKCYASLSAVYESPLELASHLDCSLVGPRLPAALVEALDASLGDRTVHGIQVPTPIPLSEIAHDVKRQMQDIAQRHKPDALSARVVVVSFRAAGFDASEEATANRDAASLPPLVSSGLGNGTVTMCLLRGPSTEADTSGADARRTAAAAAQGWTVCTVPKWNLLGPLLVKAVTGNMKAVDTDAARALSSHGKALSLPQPSPTPVNRGAAAVDHPAATTTPATPPASGASPQRDAVEAAPPPATSPGEAWASAATAAAALAAALTDASPPHSVVAALSPPLEATAPAPSPDETPPPPPLSQASSLTAQPQRHVDVEAVDDDDDV